MAKELFVYSPYKSKFEEQVSSGAVDDSQIGIIAESGELWVKGTYLPIVDLSNKADISKGVIEADGLKDRTDTTFFTPNIGLDPNTTLATQKYVTEATTNFAKDLTGVIEATPEEFTYRPSAGNRSIRDASAVIRRIKGNSFVWHQYASELSVNNYTIRGDVVTQSDNSLHITSLNPDNKIFIQALKSIPFRGHKWLSIADVKSDEELTIKGMSSVGWAPNERCLVSSFYTSTNNNAWYWGVSYKTNVPSYVDIYSFSIFDLTLMFDAGNEPTTIEEFYARIPEGVDINAYNVGKIIPMNAIAIETIGFNQWDEQWELGTLTNFGAIAHNSAIISRNFNKILPSTTYYCAYLSDVGSIGNILQIGFWDMNMVYIGRQYATNKAFTTPANAAYFKVATNTSANITTYNNDICINLSHSGVRNGEYEPYKRNTRTLPEIYKYFPYGMIGNAKVWDEINAEYAIERWGVVDLGTLTWSAEETNTSGVYRWGSSAISALPAATTSAIPNIICAKYTMGSNDNTYGRRDCVTISTSGRVRIFDSQYQETSSKEAFVASLQGVLLYYELLEPKITPITEAMQLDYVVDDFGTERAISFGNSAPFRADIVYQFNAEGRIRDNSRNIERVESTITTRLIPSQTAMLGLPNKVMTWDGYKTLMSLPIAESIAEWEMEEHPYDAIPTGKQVKDYISSITNRLIPSQSAMLGLPNKVMIWNGSTAMMSLPIAEDIDHWDLEESKLGTIPTSQQVREYIKSITDNLTPSQSATLESSNRVMVWNGDYAMTSLPIAANFAEWAEGAIPTGQQVMDYISNIKGSLSSGLMPKETIELLPAWEYHIAGNKVYEMATHPNIDYTIDLKLRTDIGVDITSDNEWRVRIDARNGFSTCALTIKPNTDGYKLRWAYPEASGVGTAPNIKAGFIWDIQFRMIGRTLLGSYKKY